jgi:hypothetical protein
MNTITKIVRGHLVEINYSYSPEIRGRMPETAPCPAEMDYNITVDRKPFWMECIRDLVEETIMDRVIFEEEAYEESRFGL